MPDITYHDIYQISFDETKKRLKIASELFDEAQEKKKAAVVKNDDNEVQKQARHQETLNNERSRLSELMEELISLVKQQDTTPIPKLSKYVVYARDQLKLFFDYHHKNETGTVDVNCNVTSLFHKTCRSQIVDMKKSKKRTYIERGIDHTFAFRIDDVVQFMYPNEMYDIRDKLLGLPGLKNFGGKANKSKQIKSIKLSGKEIVFEFDDEQHSLKEPIAIMSDYGAIWQFDHKEAVYDWFWFQKEMK